MLSLGVTFTLALPSLILRDFAGFAWSRLKRPGRPVGQQQTGWPSAGPWKQLSCITSWPYNPDKQKAIDEGSIKCFKTVLAKLQKETLHPPPQSLLQQPLLQHFPPLLQRLLPQKWIHNSDLPPLLAVLPPSLPPLLLRQERQVKQVSPAILTHLTSHLGEQPILVRVEVVP